MVIHKILWYIPWWVWNRVSAIPKSKGRWWGFRSSHHGHQLWMAGETVNSSTARWLCQICTPLTLQTDYSFLCVGQPREITNNSTSEESIFVCSGACYQVIVPRVIALHTFRESSLASDKNQTVSRAPGSSWKTKQFFIIVVNNNDDTYLKIKHSFHVSLR